ncbi:cell division protein ZipA C-terminal FtsZ-binding domain-containing protein [Halomonas binhaiensis]|uniref:Cell division protein ZipA n=1 Tax=Halomonas binhaiensis TaxID=2562282 RepID=A0A5C1NKY5_9GAMM|nr:cell division protein ZipA C-terminal FtsZ-binding domain-containing protein [Halomonas binhaiensis]QEM83057.1 cell division protein ZipA [Halomonas binhaiensis]
MELREWLIILGLALVTLIVIDGVRRLQRQRRTPRLDAVGMDVSNGVDAGERTSMSGGGAGEETVDEDANWELPNGGARVVRPAEATSRPQQKPKLERQEHPGPSRVLHEFRQAQKSHTQSQGVEDGSRVEKPRVRLESGVTSFGSSSGAAAASQEARVEVDKVEPDKTSREPVAASEVPAASSDMQAPVADAPSHNKAESVTTGADGSVKAEAEQAGAGKDKRTEPVLGSGDANDVVAEASEHEPLVADPADHDDFDEDQYRLVDFEGIGDSMKSRSRKVGSSMQRFSASMKKNLAERREHKRVERERRQQLKAEKAAEAARLAEQKAAEKAAAKEAQAAAAPSLDDNDPLFSPRREPNVDRGQYAEPQFTAGPARETMDDIEDHGYSEVRGDVTFDEAMEPAWDEPDYSKVRTHPVLEKALRHDVKAEHARDALSNAEEIIVISVMSRDDSGFPGSTLLELMMACGLRYSRDMGIFHRFETADADSALQFSMVNVLKPGIFPIEAMDEFSTPGVTLLMPLPSANDTSAAFEAMVETAMVIVRHLGGELKDENRSVMTAQTVEFARQRVQEFERRHRLHRYQAN